MKVKATTKRKRVSNLVRNKAGTSKSSETLLKLTLNILPTSCRIDNLEGVEYTVVPMILLTEGVHAGSVGPLLYSYIYD